MAGIGRHYTKEFKDSTIQLALNSEKSAYQIAMFFNQPLLHNIVHFKNI